MRVITHDRCAGYATPGHPERPQRITLTADFLRTQTAFPVLWNEPLPAPEEVILRAHSAEYVQRLATMEEHFDADTAWHPGIWEHALSSAGAALQAIELARRGEAAFSLMRPPGHHATRDQAMGFCYLSNAAIAALAARESGLERVAVFDFDVHHGNGTEDILLGEPDVAFASIHQSPCYPGTGDADLGTNVFNFPVPPAFPRRAYRRVLREALNRLLATRPALLIVSAGFDAYARDPLAQETLEAEDFHWLGEQVRAAGIAHCSLLEGGYSDDLPLLVHAYLCGLEGKSA